MNGIDWTQCVIIAITITWSAFSVALGFRGDEHKEIDHG